MDDRYQAYPESNPYSTHVIRTGQGQIVLTTEEERVLTECSKEGFYRRGIPAGVVASALTHIFIKPGSMFYSKKLKGFPATFFMGIAAYIVGKFSYYPVCMNRLLSLPNGSLRKYYDDQRARMYETPDKVYQGVEPKDQEPIHRSAPTDIDVATTESYDTMSTSYAEDYTKQFDGSGMKNQTLQNQSSYDDMRKKNRENYSRGFAPSSTREVHPGQRTLQNQQQPLLDPTPPKTTKYGDVLE